MSVTDIAEYITRERDVYWVVALDTCSRHAHGVGLLRSMGIVGTRYDNALFNDLKGFHNRQSRHPSLGVRTLIEDETRHGAEGTVSLE